MCRPPPYAQGDPVPWSPEGTDEEFNRARRLRAAFKVDDAPRIED
eukprot:gene5949-531_t